jgi:hypothetical protein
MQDIIMESNTKLRGSVEGWKEIKKKEQIKRPITPEITEGSLKRTWRKTDAGHTQGETDTSPFAILLRIVKSDLQVVTCQQEFWVTWIPEGLQYITSRGGNSSNDDITEGDA